MSGSIEPAPPRLIDWLATWNAQGFRPPSARSPLAPVHIQRAAEEVAQQLGDLPPRTPASFEIEETASALRAAWTAMRGIRRAEPRHLRRAPWALFYPRARREQWLASDDSFVRAWLTWLSQRGRANSVVALMREFLSAYPVDLPTFDTLRAGLQQALATRENLRIVRWKDRCGRFGLLERDGPDRLADGWWDSDLSFDGYLQEAGLVPGLEASAFVERATECLLVQTHSRLQSGQASPASCGRAFEWLEMDGRLRFSDQRVAVARAFLEPFVTSSPPATLQEPIRGFLCRVIGDPRINRSRWQGVPESTRNVLFRWLVSVSLEDFFRVLDETALDEHWDYRKAFWSAYLERDFIEDAWVVLGPDAARIAQRGLDEPSSAAKLRRGTGVQANHSVLLMRIGRLTIAEWSHNGKCRVWLPRNRQAPKLYEPQYTRRQLVDGRDWEQVHRGSVEGKWQSKVADYIADHTRIRVGRDEYMPQGRRTR